MWQQINHYGKQLQPHIDYAVRIIQKYQHIAQSKIYQYLPQTKQLNRFQIFLIMNATIILLFVVIKILSCLNPYKIYKNAARLSFKIPFIANKLRQQLAKSKKDFLDSYPKNHRSQIKKLSYNVVQPQFGNQSQLQSVKGHLSGSRYPDKKHSDFVVSLAKQFSYSNPLHFDLHPYVKQMEIEVMKMCAKMLNFYSDKNDLVGGFYSGGTQSILMAILAYRQYGFNCRGVTNPNIVICTTGHAAALKAADMFGIQIRLVKTDKNQEMHISDTKSKIDQNTVCVYTSFPNYPYGTCDPVHEIAYICKKRGVPMHIDMCLGGFLVPFLKKQDGSPFLVVPQGTTSISLDCHKYGLSAKGSSILLFSSQEYRKQQLFVTTEWPGGLYGTIGISGSRSGATIASAWISMMKLGVKGYTKNANNVRNAVLTLSRQLKKLGFKIYGQPDICCIGFSHPKYSVGIVKDQLKKRGWDIPIIQKPMALHYSFTPINSLKIEQMVADFKFAMAELSKKKPEQKMHKGSQLEVYGICSKIPDNNAKDLIMKTMLDLFLQI